MGNQMEKKTDNDMSNEIFVIYRVGFSNKFGPVLGVRIIQVRFGGLGFWVSRV